MNEAYPPEWKRVVVMVSPRGEVHQIAGDNTAWDLLRLRLRPGLEVGVDVSPVGMIKSLIDPR